MNFGMQLTRSFREMGYEDEKFAFTAFSRYEGEAFQGRVIRHPQIRKGHVRLRLCTLMD